MRSHQIECVSFEARRGYREGGGSKDPTPFPSRARRTGPLLAELVLDPAMAAIPPPLAPSLSPPAPVALFFRCTRRRRRLLLEELASGPKRPSFESANVLTRCKTRFRSLQFGGKASTLSLWQKKRERERGANCSELALATRRGLFLFVYFLFFFFFSSPPVLASINFEGASTVSRIYESRLCMIGEVGMYIFCRIACDGN